MLSAIPSCHWGEIREEAEAESQRPAQNVDSFLGDLPIDR
jgi:hypothetical protein